jgi:hypothetical protein
MASEIGEITLLDEAGAAPTSPTYADLVTVKGDAEYPSGGTAGFKAAFIAALGVAGLGRTILAVVDQSQPDTLSTLEYDHTNDKLYARVRTTGVQSVVADQSSVTYRILVLSY